MSYLELAQQKNLLVSHSKLESIQILNKYKNDVSSETYESQPPALPEVVTLNTNIDYSKTT